jgi:hypothetical protein
VGKGPDILRKMPNFMGEYRWKIPFVWHKKKMSISTDTEENALLRDSEGK